MRIKRCVVLLLAVIVIASAGMGISYATDGLNTNGSCVCDVAFTSAELGDPPDNEDDKDVGDVTVTLNPGGSSITIDVTTAYPGYEAYVDFTIANLGDKPINVSGIVSETYDTTALAIVVTGVEGDTVLGVGETLSGMVTIKVLPGAQQNTQYLFEVGLGFYNNECDNPP